MNRRCTPRADARSLTRLPLTALCVCVRACAIQIMPYTGSQFYAYDKLSRWIREHNDGRPTSIGQKLAAGCMAGVFAQSVSYPLDTVRRRMQVQGASVGKQLYSSSFDCVRQILRNEGVRAFYRGVLLNALRAGPSQAIQFASYGVLKSLLGVEGGSGP